MAPTTSYDQFDATKGDSFWACNTSCILQIHQTNATAGVNDMLNVQSGNIAGNAQATQFANQKVNFVWGFSTCAANQSAISTASISSSISASNNYSYLDLIPTCPQMNTVSHTGKTVLGPDGVLAIIFGSRLDFGGVPFSAYIGNFVLQLSSSDANPTASSSGTTSSTQSSTSSISNTSTTSGSPTNFPLVTASWGSGGLEPSVGASPGTIGGLSDSKPPAANQGVAIGGVVGGAVAVILIAALIWVLRRRRQRRMEAEEILSRPDLPFPRKNSQPGDRPVQADYIYTFPTPYDLVCTNEKNQEVASSSRNASAPTPFVIDSNTSGIPQPAMSSGRPSSTVYSGTVPPAYDFHPGNPHSFFVTPVAEEGGHYTLDETFRVHDLLGEWAEEYRDALPYHLERRLRSGGYVPGTHPNEIPPDVWLSRFAVTRYELAGLVELFERTSGMPSQRPQSRASSSSDAY